MITWTNQAQSSRRTKRRGRHPHHALAPAFVRTAPPGHHIDGHGLYLYVQPTGARSWIQRLVIRGRRCELGLGTVALVSLAEAREQAVANRKLARAGGDPLADRRRVQGTPTFAEAATTMIDQKRAGWKTPAQVQAWRGSLERYAFPRIGRRPISEVASADVLAILTPIWHTKPVMAKTVKQRIHTVLEWAIAMNLRTDNPSDRVGPVLGPQRNIVQHMRALPHREVAAALATVRASGAPPAVTLAFELLVLTAARSGEVRLAAWDEMDTADHVWTIPATRMKMKRDHRVPLCGRGAGDPRRRADARRRPARVPQPERPAAGCPATAPAARTLRHRLRAAWIPVQLPGLGGRGDEPSARGRRGGAGAQSPESGRGGLRPLGPVRAAAAAHGRLGRLPHRRTPTGGVVAALTPYRRWGLDPSRAATITPEDGDRSHFVGWIEGRR